MLLSYVQLFATPRLLCPWVLSRQEYWSGFPCPPPGIEPKSPELQVDSLLSEPSGKPKDTGVGSLSLLQGTFLTQETNQCLLHCRQIFYQLSYPGSLTPSQPGLISRIDITYYHEQLCSPGDIWQLSRDHFTCRDWQVVAFHLMREARDAAKHPTVHRTLLSPQQQKTIQPQMSTEPRPKLLL